MSDHDVKNVPVSHGEVSNESNVQQPSIELSGRLGFYVKVTPVELEALRGEDRRVGKETLIQLIQSGRCNICGDTYFPCFWNEDYFDGDIEFDLPILPLNSNPQLQKAENVKPKLEDLMKDAKSRQSLSNANHEKPNSDLHR